MRLGIYIGSFNPPHLGHKKVIDFLLENNYVDNVLIVPTGNYWNKTNIIEINKRIEMLKFYENDKIKIDNTHNNYPYTYELLNALKKSYPKDELYLIIGSDNLEELHKWKNIDEILKNKIIVLRRNNIMKNPDIDDANIIYVDNFDNIDISSTEIRKGNYKYLDSNIKDYIIKNNLYKENE